VDEAVDDGLDAGRTDVRDQGGEGLDGDALDFAVGVGDEGEDLVDELVLCRVVKREAGLPRFGVEVIEGHEAQVCIGVLELESEWSARTRRWRWGDGVGSLPSKVRVTFVMRDWIA
jgi:hypothetical protein